MNSLNLYLEMFWLQKQSFCYFQTLDVIYNELDNLLMFSQWIFLLLSLVYYSPNFLLVFSSFLWQSKCLVLSFFFFVNSKVLFWETFKKLLTLLVYSLQKKVSDPFLYTALLYNQSSFVSSFWAPLFWNFSENIAPNETQDKNKITG